jgi:putative transposase
MTAVKCCSSGIIEGSYTIVQRVERMWLKGNIVLSSLAHISKNLYNEANYIIRQEFFKSSSWIRYTALNRLLKTSENYKALPAQTAQQILMLVDKAWKSFFNAIREWKAHPNKFKARPRPPGYKNKDGAHILVFTNQQAKIRDGWLILPKLIGVRIRTRIRDGLCGVRIIPKGMGYLLEIVYEKLVAKMVKGSGNGRIVGIDLGSANIVTIVNNIGVQPIIVKDDGAGIKSINQYYNKRKAELQSTYDLEGVKSGDKLRRLKTKRERKAGDYIHKLSRFIVNWCVKHEIGTIVFGYNKGWKQKVNIGRRNNQTFTQIPYMDIIEKTRYKAEEEGIDVRKQEEGHTSKCSFLDDEPIEHHKNYVGKRITRSLFKSAKGTLIHADVNAGYNIGKKAIPKAFRDGCEWIGGLGLHPVRYNIDMSVPHEGV